MYHLRAFGVGLVAIGLTDCLMDRTVLYANAYKLRSSYWDCCMPADVDSR